MRLQRFWGAVMIVGGLGLSGTGAQAMPESCQKEFGPMLQKRQGYINQINGYRKRKPSAAQACATFRNLAVQNEKIGTWMTGQKDWCQIPDEMVKQFTDAQAQINQTRNTVCGAAAKQTQMMKQMQRRAAQQQRQAGPQPGSGVRLPQGAL